MEIAPALCEVCGVWLECVGPAVCDCCVNLSAIAMSEGPPLRGRGCGRRFGLICFAATLGTLIVAGYSSARLGYYDPIQHAATVGIVKPLNPPVTWQAPPRKVVTLAEPRPAVMRPGEFGRWKTGADGVAVCDSTNGCTEDPKTKTTARDDADAAAPDGDATANIAPPVDDDDVASSPEDDDDDDASMDAAKLAPFAKFDLNQPIEPPPCTLHVYRHLSKTGGTTLRFIFDKQTAMGDWEFPLIYGFKPNEWEALLQRWRAKARSWRYGGGKGVGPRTLVEVRGNWPDKWPAENFIGKVLEDVLALKSEFGAADGGGDGLASCDVTTSVLIRDPFAQYLSFYEYYIRKVQTEELKPEHVYKKWPDVPGKEAWGVDIAEWAARVHDMQTRELLGDKCTGQMRQPGYDVEWVEAQDTNPDVGGSDPGRTVINGKELKRVGEHVYHGDDCHAKVTDEDWARFEKTIESFDVVGVTENFDEFLLLLAHRVGIAHPQYVRSNSGKHERDRGKMDDKVIATVDAATVRDRKAHALAKTIQARLVAAAGGDKFERHAKKFKAQSEKINGREFIGGVPKKSPYKWVMESDAKAGGTKRVVPDAFTEETGGGQAMAYIVFDPVVLVDSTSPHRCVKGCNLDA